MTDADLRRSVSSCYYALFHTISDDAAAIVAPVSKNQLRSAVRRTITHLQIRKACDALSASPKVPVNSWRNFFSGSVDPKMIAFATIFVDLQEARYLADYDSLASFTQKDVQGLHFRSMIASGHWLAVRDTPNAAVFLTAILLGDKLGRRG